MSLESYYWSVWNWTNHGDEYSFFLFYFVSLVYSEKEVSAFYTVPTLAT